MLKRGACQIMRPGDLSQDPFSVRSSEVAQGDRPVLLHVPCPEIPIAMIGADAIVQFRERQVVSSTNRRSDITLWGVVLPSFNGERNSSAKTRAAAFERYSPQ